MKRLIALTATLTAQPGVFASTFTVPHYLEAWEYEACCASIDIQRVIIPADFAGQWPVGNTFSPIGGIATIYLPENTIFENVFNCDCEDESP